tara:strand:- start:90 stop:335 length:246 start_codon:yes stop_codon:yes gene_type:complete
MKQAIKQLDEVYRIIIDNLDNNIKISSYKDEIYKILDKIDDLQYELEEFLEFKQDNIEPYNVIINNEKDTKEYIKNNTNTK